jgi:formylglycine-generating enzyme required for sulfatase activity
MLSDFGIAKMLDSSETQTLTGTGVGIGTPEYMAPEQGLGKEIDARADIYSLGVVFFEMITGQKPFTADTPMAVIFKHMSNPLPRPGSFVKDLPSSVEKVIIKALAKKAADRYASMDDFAAELEGLIARYDKKKSAPPPLKKAPAAPQLVDPDITIDALPVHGQPWGGNENSANAYSSTAPKKLRTANIRFLLVATGIAFLIGLVIWWGKFTAVNILQTSPVTPRISTAQNNSQVATAENTPLPAPPSIVVETLSLPAWTFTPLATDTKQAITLPSPTFSPTSTFTPPATRTPTYTLPPPTTYAPTRLVSPTWTYTPSVTITPGSRPLPEQTSSPSSGNIPVETGFGIGSTTLRAKDGMTMVYVPAGSFTMGSKDGPADEKPAHQVTLDAFWIDQTEVTNGMWALCVQARGCQLPAIKRSYTRPDYYGNPQYNDYPVVSVNWSQAKGYCEWTGSRLPTEAEWEKAARGTDDRTYPWGEGIDQTYANYDGTIGDTTRVASYEKGKSLYGAYDLAGNTLEWVADLYSDNYYWWSRTSNPTGPTSGIYRVQRGGWWNANNQEARSSSRVAWDPGLNNAGLRCARSTFP